MRTICGLMRILVFCVQSSVWVEVVVVISIRIAMRMVSSRIVTCMLSNRVVMSNRVAVCRVIMSMTVGITCIPNQEGDGQ